MQNLLSRALDDRQFGHVISSGRDVPHALQNFVPSGLSRPQDGQSTIGQPPIAGLYAETMMKESGRSVKAVLQGRRVLRRYRESGSKLESLACQRRHAAPNVLPESVRPQIRAAMITSVPNRSSSSAIGCPVYSPMALASGRGARSVLLAALSLDEVTAEDLAGGRLGDPRQVLHLADLLVRRYLLGHKGHQLFGVGLDAFPEHD